LLSAHASSAVKYYGAIGNGAVDDTAAIQAAVNNTAIDWLYFPPGSYRITSTITVSRTDGLRMSGIRGNTNLISDAGVLITMTISGSFNRLQSVNVINPGGAGSIAVNVTGGANFITDIGVSSGVETGLSISGGETVVTDCWIRASATQILVQNCFSCTFVGNRYTTGTNIRFNNARAHTVVGVVTVIVLENNSNVAIIGGVNTLTVSDAASKYSLINNSFVDTHDTYRVDGVKVVGVQGAAVPDAAGGIMIDVEARAAINALLARLRASTGHGLIAT